MNPDLYSDEYRNFKFLKSSPEEVNYYKTARNWVNVIQPWNLPNDPNFQWKTRVEFIEQLLDLRNDTLYIVFAGLISSTNIYEDSKLIVIENPVILLGNPIVNSNFREITINDLPTLDYNTPGLCLIEGMHLNGNQFDVNGRIFNLKNLPIFPFAQTTFTELFYSKEDAEKYKTALTESLRKKLDTISTFVGHL